MDNITGTTLENSNLARFFRHVTPISTLETIVSIEVSEFMIRFYVGVDSFWLLEENNEVFTVTTPTGEVGTGSSVSQALANLP